MSNIWDTYGHGIENPYTQGGMSLSMDGHDDVQDHIASGFSSNGLGTVDPRMLSLANKDSPSESNGYDQQNFFNDQYSAL